MEYETKCNIFFVIMVLSLVINFAFIIHSYKTICFDKNDSIYLGSNLSIHNDVEQEYWDNLRCTLHVQNENIICAEAWVK